MTVRVGVVGLGFFAQNHLEAWRVLDGARVTAICDRDPRRVAEATACFGIAHGFTDLAAMLDADLVDVVDIVTTAPSHRAMVETVAAAGRAVICQKPMAETYQDAVAMVAACRAAGVSFTVHENFRFQRPMREIASLLREGRVGAPFFARISFRSKFDVFAAQPYLATDPRFIILDLGIHLIDLACCFLGRPRAVTCWTSRVNPAIRGEDVATLVLEHVAGGTCVIDCSYATHGVPEPFPQTMVTVEGPIGTIVLDQDFRLHHTADGNTTTRHVPPRDWPWSRPPGGLIQDSVVAFQEHWLASFRDGRPAETDAASNLDVMEMVERAYADAARRAGRPTVDNADGMTDRELV